MDGFIQKYVDANVYLAYIIVVVAAVALFTRHLSGGEFVTLASSVFTAFHAGDLVGDWMRSKRPPHAADHP